MQLDRNTKRPEAPLGFEQARLYNDGDQPAGQAKDHIEREHAQTHIIVGWHIEQGPGAEYRPCRLRAAKSPRSRTFADPVELDPSDINCRRPPRNVRQVQWLARVQR